MKYFFLVIILLICTVIFGGFFFITSAFNSANSDSSEIITFKIEQGESLQSIADRLNSSGVIKDSTFFQLYSKMKNTYPTFQAGYFRIAKNLTFEQVSNLLTKPINMQITVKIAEGLRYDEVVEQVNNQIVAQTCTLSEKDCFSEIARKFDETEFTNLIENPSNSTLPEFIKKLLPANKNLEGFLYPDTYYFKANVSSAEVLQKILANFETKFSSSYQSNYNILGQKLSFYDVMKLTSVITRESTHKTEDDKLITGVLLNRLNINYPLQCDTINHYYFKSWTYELTQADLAKNYAYNSYINTGLPPTPISNISITTFQNAISATETDYFYFLADKNGVLHYSKTWAEHVNFINQYLK